MIQKLQWKSPHLRVICRTTQWSQPHTAGSAQKIRIFLQIYTGRSKIRIWPDANKNQTMPQAVRTISSPGGVQAMEASVIPMHFSDWKYSSAIVHPLQNVLDLILCSWALLTDSSEKTTDKLPMAELPQLSIPFDAIWESCSAWSRGWGWVLGRGSDHPAQLTAKCKPHWLWSTIIKTCWPSFLQNKILCLPSSCAKPKSDLKINPLTSKETSNNDPQHSYSMEIATAPCPQLCKQGGLLQDEIRPREGQRPKQTSAENLFSSFQRILKLQLLCL